MYARSNAASQGHYTRRNNAGTVAHYAPVLCTVVLRTGDELTGYLWVNGFLYSPAELTTYLQGMEPEARAAVVLHVGLTRAATQAAPFPTVRGVRRVAA